MVCLKFWLICCYTSVFLKFFSNIENGYVLPQIMEKLITFASLINVINLPGSRIRLFQIRLPHTTQFSKPGRRIWLFQIRLLQPHNSPNQAFDCSKSDYPISHNSPNHCQPRHEASVLTQEKVKGWAAWALSKDAQFMRWSFVKKANFQGVMLICDKALSSKYVYSLEDYKRNLISIIFTKDIWIGSFLKKRRNAKLTNPLDSLLW